MVPSPNVFVKSSSFSIFGLPKMYRGSAATDGGHLILSEEQKDEMLKHNPKAQDFIRKFVGSKEVVRGEMRYCLWIGDHQVSQASEILDIKKRLTLVAEFRAASKNSVTRPAAKTPHKFWFISGHATSHTILVPRVTSERRPYLPVVRVGADVISSDLNQVLYDAPDWCIALIASRIHLVWIGTVCGKLKSDFRYSNTLGWNTFPVPKFTPEQLDALSKSARTILKTRYSHYPKTIAQLYDPKKMPDDLRAVHKANDDLLESMYREQPFHNDTERLEHLFKLYAAKIKKNSKRTEKK